jgi:guanine deaminase
MAEDAIRLAVGNVTSAHGGPFGALILPNGELLATGANRVASTNDPRAHAEIVAMRASCAKLACFQLTECELYTSCEPCPMCLGAIYWARLRLFYYASTREHAAASGFDDAYIYAEVSLPPANSSIPGLGLLPNAGQRPFIKWAKSPNRIKY